MTTPPPEESEHVTPSHSGEYSPTNCPQEDHPEAPISSEDGSVVPPTYKSQSVPPDDPFSRFWSGQMADISDKDKKRHIWLNQNLKGDIQ